MVRQPDERTRGAKNGLVCEEERVRKTGERGEGGACVVGEGEARKELVCGERG